MCSNGKGPTDAPQASDGHQPKRHAWDFLLRSPGQQSTIDRQNGDD